MLAHLLHLNGIESVVLENRDEDYVIQRVRAGVLEQGTMDTLRESGVGERMDRQGALATVSTAVTASIVTRLAAVLILGAVG